MSSTLRGYIMTKARDIADGQSVDTTNFVTKSNGIIEALDGSALTSLTPANLDSTGTIPSALLAGVGGGKVLQVQHYREHNNTSITGGASQAVHSGITITPTADTSKILVIVSGCVEGSGGTGDYVFLKLIQGGNEIGEVYNAMNYQTAAGERNSFAINVLDEPATTSQVTYELYNDNGLGSGTYAYTEVNYTLMEIAA
jgi:hypothetical protein